MGTSFDQQGQTTDNQVNVGGTAHIGQVGDQVYNTNITLLASQKEIETFLRVAKMVDAEGAAELLQRLLAENQRDQAANLFARTSITQPLESLERGAEPSYRTHLSFLKNGTVFMNRFQIKGFVGRGGFADAYIAWDLVQDREALLKRLRYVADQEQYLNRFIERERVVAARLRHVEIEGVVKTYDVVTAQGEVCLVQESIPGDSLHERLKLRGALDLDEAIGTMVRLCRAVQQLHERGIVHCDIKPLNIMIPTPGQSVLIDFGAARFMGERFPQEEIVISPFYSPPELYNRPEADARTDVYSLGITLLHMLTGLPAVENVLVGENVVTSDGGRQERIYDTSPTGMFSSLPAKELLDRYTKSSLEQIWPPALREILDRSLADYDERMETAAAFERALGEFWEERGGS